MPFLLLILLLFTSAAQGQILFQATVDQTQVRVGDQVTLTLEAKGAASGVPVPVLPSLSGLEFVGGPFRSTSMQIVNGRMSGSTIYTYILRATTPGAGKIGASALTFKGKQYATAPIEIQISASAQATPQSAPKGQTNDVFIRAHADKRKVFQNEKIVLTYTICFRSSITSPEIVRLPRTAGFWAEEFPLAHDLPVRDEVINGMQYRTAVFKQIALFPTQTGRLTVEPLALRVQVEVRSKRRDPYGLFDDPFFGMGARTETREILSPSVTIDVQPLPTAGQPSDFNGAVGDFEIQASLDKTSTRANEAVTLLFKISGEGNIKTLADPKITFPPDIEHYDPKVTDDINRSRGQITGSKTLEYLLIPRAAGTQIIAPITYSYFDPKAKRYRSLSTPELTLQVERGLETAGGSGISVATKRGVEQIDQDIAYVKVRTDAFHVRDVAPYQEVTLWLALAAPWAAVAVVVVDKRRREKLVQSPIRWRNLVALKKARQGFTRTQKLLQRAENEKFYGELAHTLRSYLAGRLNQESDNAASDELEEAWNARAWPREPLEKIRGILNECDFARFASTESLGGKGNEILRQSKEVVEEVERLMTAARSKK
jgi:hypothetical protein